MAFLPAFLVMTREELDTKLSKVTHDVIEFSEETGQETTAFHIDIILPEFAKKHDCKVTLEYQSLLTQLSQYYLGKQLRLNIHIMGEKSETEEVVAWILSDYGASAVHGEIYVHHTLYANIKSYVHHAWIIGEWYDKHEWNLETEFQSSELLLMTVVAGKSGQEAEEAQKALSYQIADTYPEYTFVLDGGWSVEESPLEPNREIVVNSHYWNSK